MTAKTTRRAIHACFAGLSLVAALSAPRPAAADDAKRVEVAVRPGGQTWALGDHGGVECAPLCRFLLAPGKYPVSMGGAKDELLIDGPTELVYDPGSPRLRTVGGWMAIGGVGLGAAALVFGVYGYAKGCTESGGCQQGTFPMSRVAARVLVFTGAALITVSVTGGILYAVSGESIRVLDLPRRAPVARRSFDVLLSPSALGATVDFVKRF